ncbi:prenyltransferase/squalene oxidase repeat-containing protein [Kitasatospora purpeofusca]|uniref:prenyltransferase/squalene oxidase repeat-containing protein n=1 Tax=Kitasatospora purpeofusca TaxID=67352 RepID=UPI0036BCED1B
MPSDIADRVRALVTGMDGISVRSSAYTTAVLSRTRHRDGTPAFPRAVEWLLTHQKADGSWGGDIPHPHDRTISTLAAITALTPTTPPPAHSAITAPRTTRAIDAGCAYLDRTQRSWQGDPYETIAFELLAPGLAASVPDPPAGAWAWQSQFRALAEARHRKLQLIPRQRLMSEPTSLLFTLEAVEPGPDFGELSRFVAANGSLVASPAATAAYWSVTADPAALAYLQHTADLHPDGGFPDVHPIRTFEQAWVLHSLHRARLAVPEHSRILAALQAHHHDQQPGQYSWDPHCAIPESDDSAMVINLLLHHGHDPRLLDSLLVFEGEDHFASLLHERDASITANAHVLDALLHRPDTYRPQISKITDFLLRERGNDPHWQDKWHTSPYYATSTALQALVVTAPPALLETTRQWLIDTQHADGSWGSAGGTAEESAYAVMGLDSLAPVHAAPPSDTWARAASYLGKHLDDTAYPELWVGKSLYSPHRVVQAAVLAGYHIASTRAGN